jgi:glycosyltransferase involved in cell wall biosynthesis
LKVSLVSINAWPLIGGLEKVGHRVSQGLQAAGDQSQIISRFTHQRHGLPGYFQYSEIGGRSMVNGVNSVVIPLKWWQRLLWLPLFRLIWRPSTFPLAVALHNAVMVPKLLRWLKGSQIVHFLGSGPELLGFAAASAARRLGIPFVVEPALHPGQWGDSWIDLRLYQQAQQLLAHSQAEHNTLTRLGLPPERITVITHGVDRLSGGDASRFRQEHQIPTNTPLILFLGRKTPEKGVNRLLQAFSAVRADLQDVLLILAGPSQPDLNIRGQQGVLNLDNLSEATKQDALAACTLLCVPSEGESFGLVYYEAWQYAKPVIALDLLSLRESIQANHAGLLVDRHDAESLVQALITLLTHPYLAAEMGRNGSQLVERHFWNSAIKSYRKAYQQVSAA